MNENNQNETGRKPQQNTPTLAGLNSLLWSIGIVVCIGAVAVGLLIAVFQRNRGTAIPFTPVIESADSGKSAELYDNNISHGVLYTLEATEDAGDSYLESIVFLTDSTFIGLRDMQLIGETQVWASATGSLPMSKLNKMNIKFPNDGSEISPSSAAMVAKPEILLIGIGMDGLAKIDKDSFISNYEMLINSIKSASPDTKIICCGLTSVIPGYTGGDGLNMSLVSDGNDWVQIVCRDTASYYLDIGEEICESVQLLSRFAQSNGKTLNRSGLQEFLMYVKGHAIPQGGQ